MRSRAKVMVLVEFACVTHTVQEGRGDSHRILLRKKIILILVYLIDSDCCGDNFSLKYKHRLDLQRNTEGNRANLDGDQFAGS